MEKQFGITVIKQNEVINEESMSMILGGRADLNNATSQRFCIILCKKLTICKPNTVTVPTDTTTNNPQDNKKE